MRSSSAARPSNSRCSVASGSSCTHRPVRTGTSIRIIRRGLHRLFGDVDHGSPDREPLVALTREDPEVAPDGAVVGPGPFVDHFVHETDHAHIRCRIDLKIALAKLLYGGLFAEISKSRNDLVPPGGPAAEAREGHGNVWVKKRHQFFRPAVEPGLVDAAHGGGDCLVIGRVRIHVPPRYRRIPANVLRHPSPQAA